MPTAKAEKEAPATTRWLSIRLDDGKAPVARLHGVAAFTDHGNEGKEGSAVSTIEVELPGELVSLLQAVIDSGGDEADVRAKRAAIKAEAATIVAD